MAILLSHPQNGNMYVYRETDAQTHEAIGWRRVPPRPWSSTPAPLTGYQPTGLTRQMAAPPTIVAGATTSMTTPILVPTAGNGNNFYPLGSNITCFMSPVRGTGRRTSANKALTTRNIQHNGFAFIYTGQEFELHFNAGAVKQVFIKVDDEYVDLAGHMLPASGHWFIKVTFATSAARRIDFWGETSLCSYVNIEASATIAPAAIRGPRVQLLGDSFTTNSTCYVNAIADRYRFDDIWISGLGGTGWLNDSSGSKPNFNERFALDVAQYQPQVLWIVAGINDLSNADALPAVDALIDKIKAAGIAVCIWSPNINGGAGRLPVAFLENYLLTKQKFLDAGFFVADTIEMPLAFPYPDVAAFPIAATVRSSANIGATALVLYGAPPSGGGAGVPDKSTIAVNGERFYIKSLAASGVDPTYGTYYTCQLESPTKTAIPAAAPWVLVGNCYLRGAGYVEATSGFGNSDVLVDADGVHPTVLGSSVLGDTLAQLAAPYFQ